MACVMRISYWSSDVCSSDILGAALVGFGLVCMLAAIQFDDEAGFFAQEVGNVTADGSLAAEFVVLQPAGAEMVPEALFGFGGVLAEGSGEVGERFRSEEHTSELQSLMRNSYAVFCLTKKNLHTT